MAQRLASGAEDPEDDRDARRDRDGGEDDERPLLGEDGGPARASEGPASQPPPHPWETLGMADALPIVIDATGPGDDGLVRDRDLPHLDSERNLSYMLQWYAFAAMAAGLWAWFTVWPRLRVRGERRGR